MFINKPLRLVNTLIAAAFLIFLGFSSLTYAQGHAFHSPYFDISLANNLSLIAKTEEENNGFYRYVFASSKDDNAALQMRVIVASKGPEQNQSVAEFELASIGAMIAMFSQTSGLSQYLSAPENQKVLSSKPDQLKLGSASFTGVTLYCGDTDVSFLVTRANDMTYAFTLISKNSNAQIRKSNLKMLTAQLDTLKLNSVKSSG